LENIINKLQYQANVVYCYTHVDSDKKQAYLPQGVRISVYSLIDSHNPAIKTFLTIYSHPLLITYKRSGTLWEGRFKSCLVPTEDYLIQLYRYIELNPVRADMVNDPCEYQWSSYQVNALGKASVLCTLHPACLAIHPKEKTRQTYYQPLFKHHLDTKIIDDIRQATHKGMAIGNDKFKDEIEKLTGKSMRPKKLGRPPKATE
jgi:REP element-mobilizing transposase RayT